MKKTVCSKLFALCASVLVLGSLLACSSDADDDDDEKPVVPDGTTATEEKRVETGGGYSNTFTISANFKTDAARSAASVESLAAGTDISSLLQSAAVSSTGESESTLSDVTATVTAISSNSMTFTVAGTAPSEDASITLGIMIPSSLMSDGEPYVKPIQKISVGDGVTVSEATCKPAYATNAQLGEAVASGKKALYRKYISDEKVKEEYYFSNDGKVKYVRYEYENEAAFENKTNPTTKAYAVDYDENTGKVTFDGKDNTYILYYVNDNFFMMDENQILDPTSGTVTKGVLGNDYFKLIMNGDNTFTYSSTVENSNQTKTAYGFGSYVNVDGVFHVNGVSYEKRVKKSDGTVTDDVVPMDTYKGLYDGSKFYLTNIMKVVDLPDDVKEAANTSTGE